MEEENNVGCITLDIIVKTPVLILILTLCDPSSIWYKIAYYSLIVGGVILLIWIIYRLFFHKDKEDKD